MARRAGGDDALVLVFGAMTMDERRKRRNKSLPYMPSPRHHRRLQSTNEHKDQLAVPLSQHMRHCHIIQLTIHLIFHQSIAAAITTTCNPTADSRELLGEMSSYSIGQHFKGPFEAELIATAKAVAAPGKGILAADESTGTIGKRVRDKGTL